MLSDQTFWFITFMITLAEIFAVCYFWERKMLQAEKQARREERRRARGY
jgi:cytochrome c biogenesis protein ResB